MLTEPEKASKGDDTLSKAFLIHLLFIVLASFSVQANEKPMRVVSINLCTDQLALMLGDAEQLKSVTFMAVDPRSSIMFEEAAGVPINFGSVEEVLAFTPDLVLAGTFGARYSVAMLRKLGYRVVVLDPANDLMEIARNVRVVANALGHSERGENMVKAMLERAASMKDRVFMPQPRAVIYRTGGRVAGEPSLGHSALELAGFINVAEEQNLGTWGSLPLEGVLRSNIDLLVRDLPRNGEPSYGSIVFMHPALKQSEVTFMTAELDGRSTICGTPYLLDAAERLLSDYQKRLVQ